MVLNWICLGCITTCARGEVFPWRRMGRRARCRGRGARKFSRAWRTGRTTIGARRWQTQLTVNQPLRLRRFESCPLHHNVIKILLHLTVELSINANGVLGLELKKKISILISMFLTRECSYSSVGRALPW